MTETRINPIVMPKWGLSMSEGKVTGWLKQPGAAIAAGDEVVEVETDKIAGVVEASEAGTLRRILAEADTVYPVKALLGIVADAQVPEAEIDAYVAGYVTPAAAGEDDAAAAGPAYAFAETDGAMLRYARRGSSDAAVILLHGFGGDLDNWLFNIDPLAEVASVYALDLPGHGQSSKAIADASIGGLSRAVLAFMDKLGIAGAHLVGHSMGGAVAVRTAADAPERVRSLSLIASAGLGEAINGDYIDGFVAATSRRELKPLLGLLFADEGLVSRKLVDDVLKYKRLDGVSEALGSLASSLFPGGRQKTVLTQALARFDRPVLVIWGTEDRIIPPADAQGLASPARVELIAGAGHMVQMEKANRVNELLLQQVSH